MTQLRLGIVLTAALIALAALPPVAFAAEESLIPPGNSAVNQYTESFPTSSGDRNSDQGDKRSPSKVLGHRKAQRLEEQGPDGRAAAEVAAETAPVADSDSLPSAVGSFSGTDTPGGGGAEKPGPGAGAQDSPAGRGATDGAALNLNGSSGFGEVLGQATGATDSGEMGLLLPLAILAVIAWSIAFLLRQSRRAGP